MRRPQHEAGGVDVEVAFVATVDRFTNCVDLESNTMKPFLCPSCEKPLASDQHPLVAGGYFTMWCPNKRCPSDVAQWDGGSGPTQEAAYRSLCAAVDHESEMLSETEEAIAAQKEKDLEFKADRDMDRERAGGP
jgi:hypothetical protein